MKRFFFVCLWVFCCLLVSKAEAQSPSYSLPDYRWMSERFNYEGRGLAYGDVDGDGLPEIVTIDLNHVYLYQLVDLQLQRKAIFTGSKEDQFVRVYTLDVDGDGREEILLSNLRGTQAASLALSFFQGQFKVFFERAPWILKVFPWEGKKMLLGEMFTGKDIEKHRLKRLQWKEGRLSLAGDFPSPAELGLYGLQEFKISPSGSSTSPPSPWMLYLSPSGQLKIFESSETGFRRSWTSGERYGGTSNSIRHPTRNMFNGVEEGYFTYFNLEPLSWMNAKGEPVVLVAKNETYLKNILGTRPILKNTSFIKLGWESLGLREEWSTRKIDGYASDYLRIQLPGEVKHKLLVLFWLRDKGLGSSVAKFQSVLALYELDE